MNKTPQQLADDMSHDLAVWLLHPSKSNPGNEDEAKYTKGELKAFYAGMSAAYVRIGIDNKITEEALELSIERVKRELLSKTRKGNE